MAKGEEFGYSQFDGSDMIILFQAGVDVHTDTDLRKVGCAMGQVLTAEEQAASLSTLAGDQLHPRVQYNSRGAETTRPS